MQMPLSLTFSVSTPLPMYATLLANDPFWQDSGAVGVGFWRLKRDP
jgi:hypothetical protein